MAKKQFPIGWDVKPYDDYIYYDDGSINCDRTSPSTPNGMTLREPG